MEITVKSPQGTDIKVNLANNTVTIDKINMLDQPIQGWYMTQLDGENCQYVKADNKNIIIAPEFTKTLFTAKNTYRQQALEKSVPGITLLQAAMRGEAAYFEAMQVMMDNEMNDGVNPPIRPDVDTESLKAKYPRAALYVKADAYSDADHYAKSDAGKKAKNLLESGGSEADAENILTNWSKDTYLD